MRCNLFGIPCTVTDREELLRAIAAGEKVRVATPNPEILLAARSSQPLQQAVCEMTHCLVDGTGTVLWWRVAQVFFPLPAISRVAGASFCENLFTLYADGSRSFAFLGSSPGIAQQAAENLRQRFPAIRIVFSEDGGTPSPDGALDPAVRTRLLEAKPDITLVTFGAPKQELVIHQLKDSSLPAMLGVGGTLHFFVDRSRAPRLLRNLGLEWLWRLFTVPGHWRRVWRAVGVFSFVALGWILQGAPQRSVRQ